MGKPTLAEMETGIVFDRSSDTARIYTADPVMMRKIDKLALETPCVQAISRDEWGRVYHCPKSMIRIQKPRQLSEEQRARLAQRFQNTNQ